MSANAIGTHGKRSAIDPQKHICVIQTTKGRILSIGVNHSIANTCLPSIHAEPHAISKAVAKLTAERGRGFRPPKVDIVVARTNMGNSRPCSECAYEIFANPYLNIRRVIYSDPTITTNTNTNTNTSNNSTSYTSNNNANSNGYTSIRPNDLFDTRYQHITKYNLRQLGFMDPDTNVLYNPYNLVNTENSCLDADCDASCNHHCHDDDDDESGEESDEDTAKKRYPHKINI